MEDETTEINMTDLILDDGNYKGKLVKYFKKIVVVKKEEKN